MYVVQMNVEKSQKLAGIFHGFGDLCRLPCRLIDGSSIFMNLSNINYSHFAFIWKKYQFNMHAKRNIMQIQKILFIFYNNCKKKSKKKPWQTMVRQKTPKGQKIAIPETIVHHEIPRNFLTREWPNAKAICRSQSFLVFGLRVWPLKI